MTEIKKIDRALCRFSVFRGLFDTPVFRKFFAYAEAEAGSEDKLNAYGTLVSEIYEGGGSLAACVRRALFEDENVYVRAIAKGGEVNAAIEAATKHELEILSAFASLAPADFAKDMEENDFLPAFESEKVDLAAEYGERVESIGRYGYGIFASYGMFSVDNDGHIKPIESADDTSIDSFIGYAAERQRVMANTEAFLEVVNPTYAVICSSIDNSYGHPHGVVVERLENVGATVLMTATDGEVVLECNKSAIWHIED